MVTISLSFVHQNPSSRLREEEAELGPSLPVEGGVPRLGRDPVEVVAEVGKRKGEVWAGRKGRESGPGT